MRHAELIIALRVPGPSLLQNPNPNQILDDGFDLLLNPNRHQDQRSQVALIVTLIRSNTQANIISNTQANTDVQ